MHRVTIRNVKSKKPVKPRIFDLIKEERSKDWQVEIQGKSGKEVISLSTLLLEILKQTQEITEP